MHTMIIMLLVLAESNNIAPLSKAYVDATGAVHQLLRDGRDVRLTSRGKYEQAKAGASGIIGALRLSPLRRSEPYHDTIMVAESLVLFRNGRIIRSIRPGGFIRDWSFYNADHQVTIYSGALHFAGYYFLVDAQSGRVLAQSRDPVSERSPPWVRSLHP